MQGDFEKISYFPLSARTCGITACERAILITGAGRTRCPGPGFSGKTKGEPIDYIFTSRDLVLREVRLHQEQISGGFPSDHYPVVAQVEL